MTREQILLKIQSAFENDLEKADRQEWIDFYETLEDIGKEGQKDMSEVY